MEQGAPDSESGWRSCLIRTPLGWTLSLAAAAAGVYLVVTHTGHVLSALPYLLLVACPLMHVSVMDTGATNIATLVTKSKLPAGPFNVP